MAWLSQTHTGAHTCAPSSLGGLGPTLVIPPELLVAGGPQRHRTGVQQVELVNKSPTDSLGYTTRLSLNGAQTPWWP